MAEEAGKFEIEKEQPIEDTVVKIYRCSKVVKGGRRFSFAGLVVVGDRNGTVGIGYGKANEVPQAVEKAVKDAKKNLVNISLVDGTLPHMVEGKCIVHLAMRYGRPDIRSGLEALKTAGVEHLIVLPLYPQYSGTTTEAVYDAVSAELRSINWFPKMNFNQKYHDRPVWIKAVANSIREFQSSAGKPDKLIFSMHGIFQRYVKNGDPYAL